MAAGLDIHRDFTTEVAGHLDLALKIGVHAGPCMAVNLNGRVDYFGTTVNTAVRLEGHSLGGDVVVRADLIEDPNVAQVLAEQGTRVERGTAELKGFDQLVEICRIARSYPTRTILS